jgi:SAM-dependent methyltransferase
MDILKILAINKTDKYRWVKYYELETRKYYDYIIPFLPINHNVLEIGCGAGRFYADNQDILENMNNKYTCVDIDEGSIEYAKQNCEYVEFRVANICDFTSEDLKIYDTLLLVQSYVQVQEIDQICKRYFDARPDGCIMMVNTIFPDILCDIATTVKKYTLPHQNNITRTSLSLNKLERLRSYIGKQIINIHICKSIVGFEEYLTIIR